MPEIFAAIAILTVLLRRIKQNLKPLWQAFTQNIIAVVALAAATAIPNTFFFSNLRFNSINGIVAIGAMSIVGVSVWFIVLRLLKNEESAILKEKAVQIINRVWKP